MYRMQRDALRGLILALRDVPEKQRASVLAQWERQVIERGDLERLRAIRDYRSSQQREQNQTIAQVAEGPGSSEER